MLGVVGGKRGRLTRDPPLLCNVFLVMYFMCNTIASLIISFSPPPPPPPKGSSWRADRAECADSSRFSGEDS